METDIAIDKMKAQNEKLRTEIGEIRSIYEEYLS